MRNIILIALICFVSDQLWAQDEQESIVEIVDELTTRWDSEADILKTYEGMRDYCKSRQHRVNTIELTKEIHHYDSVLYQALAVKYDETKDKEIQSILREIRDLEEKYTTKGFLNFLHKECSVFNDIENNYGRSKGKQYQKEVAKMEKELSKYVNEITQQIDLIDEHIHHVEGI